jgi:hypothetical protein
MRRLVRHVILTDDVIRVAQSSLPLRRASVPKNPLVPCVFYYSVITLIQNGVMSIRSLTFYTPFTFVKNSELNE